MDSSHCLTREIASPQDILTRYPLSDAQRLVVAESREMFAQRLAGESKKFLCILGPCSVDSPQSCLELAYHIEEFARRYVDEVLFMIRVYIEKPRTRFGWKGFLMDPWFSGTDDPAQGIIQTRELMLKLLDLRLAIATEFLTPFVSHYFQDCVTWGSIGARTSASPIHRQMASSFSFPIGVKNFITGSFTPAIDALLVAREPQSFLNVNAEGKLSHVHTLGNPFAHLVLRGGADTGPNYFFETTEQATQLLAQNGLPTQLLIDCSHHNSQKNPRRQVEIFPQVFQRSLSTQPNIMGAMLETHLHEGSQKTPIRYGVSLTDPCLDIQTTLECLETVFSPCG